jgi:hypothetical protein
MEQTTLLPDHRQEQTMSEQLEQQNLYGHGRVNLTANVSQGEVYLQQISEDHDFCMCIQISSLTGIERLEGLLARAKQQLLTQN